MTQDIARRDFLKAAPAAADAGRQHYDDKDYPRRVRAVRAF